jgi:hypothetical protein
MPKATQRRNRNRRPKQPHQSQWLKSRNARPYGAHHTRRGAPIGVRRWDYSSATCRSAGKQTAWRTSELLGDLSIHQAQPHKTENSTFHRAQGAVIGTEDASAHSELRAKRVGGLGGDCGLGTTLGVPGPGDRKHDVGVEVVALYFTKGRSPAIMFWTGAAAGEQFERDVWPIDRLRLSDRDPALVRQVFKSNGRVRDVERGKSLRLLGRSRERVTGTPKRCKVV